MGRHARRVLLAAAIVLVAAACAVGPQAGSPAPAPIEAPTDAATAAPATGHPTHPPSPRETSALPSSPAATSPTPAVPSASPSPAAPSSTESPSTESPSPTERAGDPDRLEWGDRGPAVADLQARLAALGYWVGDVDGTFGESTHHAVVALQKAAGIGRDGIVGPATRQALAAGARPTPQSAGGPAAEIDLARQLLLVVGADGSVIVFDTSTGRPGWTTPAGSFSVQREIDGWRESRLGVLYRPRYFNQGIAVHGAPHVPPVPASHGCVRVTNAAMDWIWAHGVLALGTPVWVY